MHKRNLETATSAHPEHAMNVLNDVVHTYNLKSLYCDLTISIIFHIFTYFFHLLIGTVFISHLVIFYDDIRNDGMRFSF